VLLDLLILLYVEGDNGELPFGTQSGIFGVFGDTPTRAHLALVWWFWGSTVSVFIPWIEYGRASYVFIYNIFALFEPFTHASQTCMNNIISQKKLRQIYNHGTLVFSLFYLRRNDTIENSQGSQHMITLLLVYGRCLLFGAV
ncbi:hypothetical protein ACJX0J_010566, partial [Zea mays]